MRTSRFTEEQILTILRAAETGDAVTVCRRHGIGRVTL
jgi:Transposase